jgi:redox-sensing transcriptional repressor
MTVSVKQENPPEPVVRRLPRYLIHVRELRKLGVEWISSQRMAEALGLTSSTVRQDLSHLDLTGVAKRGYETGRLEEVLRVMLVGQTTHRAVIVGAGYLGCALALHGDLSRHEFLVCGIFDKDPEIVGTKVGELSIRPMDALKTVVRKRRVELGIVAVPASAAQSVADLLTEAGVQGILNLAYVHLRVPPGVVVVDARLLASLQQLAYAVRAQNGVYFK